MSVCPTALLLLLLVVMGFVRLDSAAYCDNNLFLEDKEQRLSGVQFTKELSTTEYGSLSSFKTLHCCGKRYLSLEWFKDNRPYPWPGDVSSFILNPESANQTIYTRSLTSSDHGLYTCQLANQTNIVNHSIILDTIDDKTYWGDPLPTYQLPKEHYAQPGDSARLYCEGFVGNIDLPDAVNTIKWKKTDENKIIEPNEKYIIEEVTRENIQVLGAFLFINKIDETDYGQYICSISNTDDQILQQFTNITKPVFNNKQSDKKVQTDLKLIIFVMLALILIVWKRRCFFSVCQKKFENDKIYALSEKAVHSVIVFYDEYNKKSAQYLVDKMEHCDTYIIKKYHTDFNEDFIKTHIYLAKDYDFAVYLLSSDDTVPPSLMTKLTQKSFIYDNSSPKKYVIDCSNMSATLTKSWCDRVLADLQSSENTYRNTPNKLIQV